MKLIENEHNNANFLRKTNFPASELTPFGKSIGPNLEIDSNNLFLYIRTMHRWAVSSHSSRFWQMNIPFKEFEEHYKRWINSGNGSVHIVCAENIPISQADTYQIQDDPLEAHVNAKNTDLGIHFLMAPYRELLTCFGTKTRGLAAKSLQAVLEKLFRTQAVTNVYAEPDIRNQHACDLADKIGFTFLKKITLEEKEAKLFKMSREKFLSLYNCSQ